VAVPVSSSANPGTKLVISACALFFREHVDELECVGSALSTTTDPFVGIVVSLHLPVYTYPC
jgi:hypothetical protein